MDPKTKTFFFKFFALRFKKQLEKRKNEVWIVPEKTKNLFEEYIVCWY